MLRLLSHIIIFLLLIVSPVSFSTSSIPNFYILVTMEAPLKESEKSAIAILERTVEPNPSFCLLITQENDIPEIHFIPNAYILEIPHGRAPPAISFA